MVFSSITFMFLCLPIVLTANYLLPRWLSNPWLLLASLFFYAWGEPTYVWVMLLVIGMNFGFGLIVDPARAPWMRHWGLVLGTIANLSVLVACKYANFLADNLNVVLTSFSLPTLDIPPVHLPLGISFYTFQSMSYMFDVYRGMARVQRNPLNLGLYVALFPQLIAGPIVMYEEVAEQLRNRRVTWEGTAYGVRRFLLGLGKKVLIANTVAVPAAHLRSPHGGVDPRARVAGHCLLHLGRSTSTFPATRTWPSAWAKCSASGSARTSSGLHAQSIREFWRRWHISLSSWFRDYLYIPLGGNRYGNVRTGFNLVTVFFLCGLWHGASWTFVVWGLYHGAFLVLERTRFGGWMDRAPRVARHAYVLLAVMVGWVFFRVETLDQAWAYLGAMAGFVDATAESDRGTSATSAKMEVPFGGLYAVVSNEGFTSEVAVRRDRYDAKITNSDAGLLNQKLTGNGVNVSGSASYRINVLEQSYIEPTIGLSWTETKLRDLPLAFGALQFGKEYSLLGRIGVTAGTVIQASDKLILQPFASAAVWHEFRERSNSNFAVPGFNVPVQTDRVGTFGQLGLGLAARVLETGWAGFVRGDVRFGSKLNG
ncbi:MAG: autotransporter domain-containing protein, partial [Candidatus Competibacteraceae bacterium]|nr:autotransporter domain-containing protein [Candidatus Competibacteraceae bacterium]